MPTTVPIKLYRTTERANAAAKAAAQGTPYSKSEVYKQMLALQAGETEE